MQLTMNGHQLAKAMGFVNPDGEDVLDQRDAEVSFEVLPARKNLDGEDMPEGLYCWLSEYPEEGSIHLAP